MELNILTNYKNIVFSTLLNFMKASVMDAAVSVKLNNKLFYKMTYN